MGYAYRRGSCTVCGRVMEGRFKRTSPWRCIACTEAHQLATIAAQRAGTHPSIALARASGQEIARQIAAQEGPRYEAWRRGMERYRQRRYGHPPLPSKASAGRQPKATLTPAPKVQPAPAKRKAAGTTKQARSTAKRTKRS